MGLNPGEPRAHEIKRFSGLAATFQRLSIDLGPEGRPGIVGQHAVQAAGEAHIVRQIFAKIGHPTGETDVEHILADDGFSKPVCRFLLGKIDDAAEELSKINQIGGVCVLFLGEKAARQGLGIEGAVDAQIGIDIAHEANPFDCEVLDALWQVGIALGIPPPVPKEPPPKGGFTQAYPVFAPKGRHGCARGLIGLQARKTPFAALQANDRAVQHPIGQGRLSAKPGRERADQGGKIRFSENLYLMGRLPGFKLVKPRMAKVKGCIGRGIHMQRIAPRREEGWLRIVGAIIVAARLGLVGQEGQEGRLVAANAGFGGP